jgi:hypothetical protein
VSISFKLQFPFGDPIVVYPDNSHFQVPALLRVFDLEGVLVYSDRKIWATRKDAKILKYVRC